MNTLAQEKDRIWMANMSRGQTYQVKDGGIVPRAHAIVALLLGPPVHGCTDKAVIRFGNGGHCLHGHGHLVP